MEQFGGELGDGFSTTDIGRTKPLKTSSDVLGCLPCNVITGTAEVLVFAAVLENVVFDFSRKRRRLCNESKEKSVLACLSKGLAFMTPK